MIDTAMILAAGYGTRLRPLTDNKPKALVEFQGHPLIWYALTKLINSGIKKIIVNTHYLPLLMEEYFAANNFNAEIYLSFEEKILGTGGAIKYAEPFLKDTESFVIHNADVISEIDLSELIIQHQSNKCLATLAVNEHNTLRPLIADSNNYIIGRKKNGEDIIYSNSSLKGCYKSFCGVSVVSSEVFSLFKEDEFDMIIFYMEQIKAGKKIKIYDMGNANWKDMGKIEDFN